MLLLHGVVVIHLHCFFLLHSSTFTMSNSKALASVTNTLKREAQGGASATSASLPKKLKTLDKERTMTEESAKEFLETYRSTTSKQAEKKVRDQQKRVRELKKELKQAEADVVTAKQERDALSRKMLEASEMEKSDVDRIIEWVKINGSSFSSGYDAIHDILAISQEPADLVKLAEVIGASTKRASMQQGALNALMGMGTPSVEAIKTLFTKILENGIKTDPEIFPAVVPAIARFGTDHDATQLVSVLFTKADLMRLEKTSSYSYRLPKCPIIELLYPTWNVMRQQPNLVNSTKTSLVANALKSAINESINAVDAPPNYSMPEEAAIAKRFNCPELERILLSPTETSVNLYLTKDGRMQVHRLIDNHIGYGKLSHESQGSGRDRYLVVRKKSAPTNQEIQERKQRKEKHADILRYMTAV